MIIILGSIVNVIWGWGLDAIRSFIEHKNLHFDNELNIHVSSQNHEESGYGLFLDLLNLLYQLRISHPRRSGLDRKYNHLRPIYLLLITASKNQPLEVPNITYSTDQQAISVFF